MLKQLTRCWVFVFAVLFSAFAIAQPFAMPMADHVPADAVAYIGWAGADSQSTVYQSSNLSAFVDKSNLAQVAAANLPKFWDKIVGSDGQPDPDGLKKSLRLLWHHPVAIYGFNVGIKPNGSPDANVALICDAGPDATELRSALESAVQNDGHFKIFVDGSLVTLIAGGAAQAAPARDALVGKLADQPAFIAAMKSLQASPSFAVYIDAKTILEKANQSVNANEKAAEIWPKARDALGIAAVKSFAMTAGFEKNNWMVATRLVAPRPRTGLLAAVEPKPIDPVLLARIPAASATVSVYNFDAAKMFDVIGQVSAVSPTSDRLFHQAAGLATIALGRNFRQQILAPLGPQWVMYCDAKPHSVVVLNHPTDPDTASDSMVSAVFGVANLANTQIPGAATQPAVTLEQKTVSGVDLTSAVTRLVSPTFAVKDGVLYAASSQNSLVASATLPATRAGSDILHSTNFAAALYGLNVPELGSFDYCNLPATAPLAYENFGSAGEQLHQMTKTFNFELPKIELPALEQFAPHLSPALSVSWADDQGVYSKAISPFPFSIYLLGSPQQNWLYPDNP